MKYYFRYIAATLALILPASVWAADGLDSGDTAWILASTALVLFMTLPGLALFYSGLVRRKNVLSVLTQCFAIASLISILWMVYGYSLAFGDGGGMNAIIGNLDNLLMVGIARDSMSGTIPESLFASFQMTFAIITVALIVGSFAERMRFGPMLLFAALWFTVVYVPVAHWVWGGGWLSNLGAMDFAGGLVVHITAGTTGLVAALMLGKRNGFGNKSMPPHNLPMSTIGAGMLWVGWFGFNAGSALGAGTDAAMALLVTQLATAAAALSWMVMDLIKHGKASLLGLLTGVIAGLVAVTPASGFIDPAGALILGVVAGVVCFQCTHLIKNKLKIDDSLDVFPVHGVGGIVGSIMVAFLAAPSEGNTMATQIWVQVFSSLFVIVWTVIASVVILFLIKHMVGLRVDDETETIGLDLRAHNEQAYDI